MSSPLEGFLVVDLSTGAAGPRATGMLADYGADVVWVEPPGGDPLRVRDPAAASVFNRGKRSMVLDVTDHDDRSIVIELLRRADVVVHNWSPGFAESVGLGERQVHDFNPGVIYCSLSACGLDGPNTELPQRDAFIHALVGAMAEQAGHRSGPIYMALPFATIGTSYVAAIGILAAVYRRESDGRGRVVETSLLDGALAYLSVSWGENDADLVGTNGVPAPTSLMTVGKRFVTRSFRCADGTYIGIHTGAVGAFSRLMAELGLDDRIPPSATGMDMGVDLLPHQIPIVADEIPAIIGTRTRAEWIEALLRVDVCAVEHMAPCDVFDTPQAEHNKSVIEVDDPVLGRVQQVGPGLRISTSEAVAPNAAPTLGQDQHDVLDGLRTNRWPLRIRPAAEFDGRPLLDGVRIVDFGAYFAGPYSSRLLADLGADVIKVEPLLGDQQRGLERCFNSAQAGKVSLAANMKANGLRPVARRLFEWADIVHHNMRPGAAERLGLGYEDMMEARPDGIYVHAPGWGSTGPYMQRQSFAPMLSGYVGVTSEVAGSFNPPLPPLAHEDPGNGLLGAMGMLLALIHRQRTGHGAYLENPQLNAAMAHVAHIVRTIDGEVIGAGRLDVLQTGRGALNRLYQTADGWVCVVAETDDEIHSLELIAGLAILDNKEFATAELRDLHDYDLQQLIGAALETMGTTEVATELTASRIGVAVRTERQMHTVLNDPWMRATRRVGSVAHRDPVKGLVREIDQVVRISDSVVPPHRFAPGLGEHTVEVLERLGFTTDEIDVLCHDQVVLQGP